MTNANTEYNAKPSDELTLGEITTFTTATIGAARVENTTPVGYRLVTERDEGSTIYMLQGYFTWTQGLEYGGEWRDLKTQNWQYARDDVPFVPLPLNTPGGPR
jgi:hypothetical protein